MIFNLISENKIKEMIALTERNGLYVTDSEIKLIGKENAFYIKDGVESKIPVGKIINEEFRVA